MLDLSAILSPAAAPCAMFVVGAVLADNKTSAQPLPAIYMSVFKLLVFPVLVWFVLGAFDIEDNWRMAASLGAAMPAAAVLTVVAEDQDTLPGQASMAVLLSTLISVVTIAAWLVLISASES